MSDKLSEIRRGNQAQRQLIHQLQNEQSQQINETNITQTNEVRLYNDRVSIEIFVIDTGRRLCTIYLSDQQTINTVKMHILQKNKNILIRTLFLNEQQLINRIIKFYSDGIELTCADTTTLRSINYLNNTRRRLFVKFVRAYAFLTESQLRDQVLEINTRTDSLYHSELILQAINMAPQCKLNQTLSNLVNNCSKVFESILFIESKDIINEVKQIRQSGNFPTIRVRYQILGEQYRQIILDTFRIPKPNVYNHLIKRVYFCQYMLQVGMFSNPALDQLHQQLYTRILNTYLQLQQQGQIFGGNGDLDLDTHFTHSQYSQDIDYDLLSQVANQNGKVIQVLSRAKMELLDNFADSCKDFKTNELIYEASHDDASESHNQKPTSNQSLGVYQLNDEDASFSSSSYTIDDLQTSGYKSEPELPRSTNLMPSSPLKMASKKIKKQKLAKKFQKHFRKYGPKNQRSNLTQDFNSKNKQIKCDQNIQSEIDECKDEQKVIRFEQKTNADKIPDFKTWNEMIQYYQNDKEEPKKQN